MEIKNKLVVGLAVGFLLSSVAAFGVTLTTNQRALVRSALPNAEFADLVSDTLDNSASEVGSVTFSVGAEASDEIIVALTLKDVRGNTMTTAGAIQCYASSDSAGATPTATFEGLQNIIVGSVDQDGSVFVTGTNMRLVQGNTSGSAEVVFQESSTTNYYLNCITPNGELFTSAIVDFS